MTELLEGISTRLKELYPEFHNYIYKVDQNLSLPCFVISNIRNSIKPRVGARFYDSEESFQVAILSDDTDQVRDVMEYLMIALDRIPYKDGQDFLTHNRTSEIRNNQATMTFDIYRTLYLETPKYNHVRNMDIDIKVDKDEEKKK